MTVRTFDSGIDDGGIAEGMACLDGDSVGPKVEDLEGWQFRTFGDGPCTV